MPGEPDALRPGEALIDRLRRWLWGRIERAARIAARRISRGRSSVGPGPAAESAGAPVATGPASPAGHRGPPADWLARVRRGAPDLLVPGRIPTMRAPGWKRRDAPQPAGADPASPPFLPSVDRGDGVGPVSFAHAALPERETPRHGRDAPDTREDRRNAEANDPDDKSVALPRNDRTTRPDAPGAPAALGATVHAAAVGPGARASRPRVSEARAGETPALPARRLVAGRKDGHLQARADDVAAPPSEETPPRAARRVAPLVVPTRAHPAPDSGRPRPIIQARPAAFSAPPVGERPAEGRRFDASIAAPVPAITGWDGVRSGPEPSLTLSGVRWLGDDGAVRAPEAFRPFPFETRPGDRPGPIGFPGEGPEDPWPTLPDDRPDEVEDGATLLRAWERRQRLDREQRGVGWNG